MTRVGLISGDRAANLLATTRTCHVPFVADVGRASPRAESCPRCRGRMGRSPHTAQVPSTVRSQLIRTSLGGNNHPLFGEGVFAAIQACLGPIFLSAKLTNSRTYP